MAPEAIRGDISEHGNRLQALIQEDEIDREPHPEGMHRPTARDQQSGTRSVPIEASETQQSAPCALSDGHLQAANPLDAETAKPVLRECRKRKRAHSVKRGPSTNLAP